MQEKEVVCLVFQQGGKVLLEQRLDDNLYRGSWTFPGGKVEKVDYKDGEDYIFNASVREAGEETGLMPKEIELFTSFEAETRHSNWFLFHGILVKRFSGDLQNRESGRRILVWEPIPKAKSLVSGVSVNKRILADYLTHLKNI